MDIRSVRSDELPQLLELCRRTLPLDPFTPAILRRRVLDEAERDPALQLGAWDGPQLAGVMLAGVRQRTDGPVAGLRLFAVDERYRRRGVASQLLGELEQTLRRAGHTRLLAGGIAPDYFWPGVDVRYTPAVCFLQRHGFERRGDAINMLVDLASDSWDTTGDEARLAAEGITVRRLQPEDRERFGAWLAAEWNTTWQWEGLASYANDPASTWLATDGDQIRAFASYRVASFENNFGPTGTQPAWQGRGMGRVLFHRCMRDLKEQGHATAEIGWVGPICFYTRVAGAVINRVFWTFGKELQPTVAGE